ncbi:hypothetical protein GCM10027440_23040 [Nocardiopsis coralliicola]
MAWGLPPDTPARLISKRLFWSDSGEESDFPYSQLERPHEVLPSERERIEREIELGKEGEEHVQELRDAIDCASLLAGFLPKSEVREIYMKLEAIVESTYGRYSGTVANDRFLELEADFFVDREVVSRWIVGLPKPTGGWRCYSGNIEGWFDRTETWKRIRKRSGRRGRELSRRRSEILGAKERIGSSGASRLLERVKSLFSKFFPGNGSGQELGVDEASLISALGDLGYGPRSPFRPSFYRWVLIPQLKNLGSISYEDKGKYANLPDYMVDRRIIPPVSLRRRIRIPAGMIRIRRVRNFAVVSVQLNERIHGDSFSRDSRHYRSIVLGISPAGSHGDNARLPGKYLDQVEKILLDDARRQNISTTEILHPENCPFVINHSVDPETGIAWDRSSRELKEETITEIELEAFRAGRIQMDSGGAPELSDVAEWVDRVSEVRLRMEGRDNHASPEIPGVESALPRGGAEAPGLEAAAEPAAASGGVAGLGSAMPVGEAVERRSGAEAGKRAGGADVPRRPSLGEQRGTDFRGRG